ncbi:MAG: RNA polymerase sigma factor [Planctomycetota bacterium]
MPASIQRAVPPDQALLVRLVHGDDAAREELVRANIASLLTTARHLLGDGAAAAELVQDVFAMAFGSLSAATAPLSDWLRRLLLVVAARRERSAPRGDAAAIDDLLPEFLADGHRRYAATPWRGDEAIDPQELRRRVARGIERLPRDHRLVIALCDGQGMSTTSIAHTLGRDVAVVETQLRQARMALREMLDGTLVRS